MQLQPQLKYLLIKLMQPHFVQQMQQLKLWLVQQMQPLFVQQLLQQMQPQM